MFGVVKHSGRVKVEQEEQLDCLETMAQPDFKGNRLVNLLSTYRCD